MNISTELNLAEAILIARQLAGEFALTAARRDEQGGTPKKERDALRRSGLLSLSIPKAYGGLGANWQQTLGVVREFARVDSALAHVYGFQHLMLATVRLFGSSDQWQPWYRQSVHDNWFWGNALNPLDTRTTLSRHPGYYTFSGKKSFCSGATDSDRLIASAVDPENNNRLLIAVLPTQREGITLHNDWNNMGQRQTDSGSVSFERVRVDEDELLLKPGPLSTPFATLRPLLAQLIFVNLFLGVAEGAFEQARDQTLTRARPWFRSDSADAGADPYVLLRYGEFWAELDAMRALTERANGLFDDAWYRAEALQEDERARLAIAIGSAKVNTTRMGLDLTSRLFEVTGASATHASYRLDRFWRNLRTQTLHDPVDYRLRELGEWGLHARPPKPSFYS